MLVVLLALLLSAAPAFADPGDLDPSFGDGGVARVPFAGGGVGTARDAVVQADGKVVTVGGDRRRRLRDRALPRGRDARPGFSDDGRLTLSFGGSDAATRSLQQPDGKLLVAGAQRLPAVVVRLTAAW